MRGKLLIVILFVVAVGGVVWLAQTGFSTSARARSRSRRCDSASVRRIQPCR